MDLSIVIVSWNVREHLARCLASIGQLVEEAGKGLSFEVFVVDNASTDGTAEWLKKLPVTRYPLLVTYNNVNRGFAAANNQAIRQARGEFILLLNPDTEFSPSSTFEIAPTPHLPPPRTRSGRLGGSAPCSSAFPENSSAVLRPRSEDSSSNSAVRRAWRTPSVAVPHYAAEGGSGGLGLWIDTLRGWHRVASARLYAALQAWCPLTSVGGLAELHTNEPAAGSGRMIARRQCGTQPACRQAGTPEREELDRSAPQTLDSNPLHTLLTFMRAHPKCGIAGPMLRNADGTLQRSVRRFPRAWDPILFSLGVTPKKYCMTDFDYTRESKVDQVMGACFLIRRKCLDAIGLLDERFFIWFEEVDYCRRAKEAGWEVWYTPDAALLHHGGESFAQILTTKKQWIYSQSLLRYFAKYHAWGAWILNALFVIPRLCIALLLYRNAHHRS